MNAHHGAGLPCSTSTADWSVVTTRPPVGTQRLSCLNRLPASAHQPSPETHTFESLDSSLSSVTLCPQSLPSHKHVMCQLGTRMATLFIKTRLESLPDVHWDSAGLGRGLSVCLSTKLPRDADDAGEQGFGAPY